MKATADAALWRDLGGANEVLARRAVAVLRTRAIVEAALRDELLHRLDEPESRSRARACDALADSRIELDSARIRARLRDGEPMVRGAAARCLAARAERNPATVLALVLATGDGDPRAHATALASLAVLAPSAPVLRALGRILASDRHSVGATARETLRYSDSSTVDAALALLETHVPADVRGALEIAHATDRDLSAHLEALSHFARPGVDAFVRRAAARAIGHCGRAASAAASVLRTLRDEWDAALRITAVVSLGQLAHALPRLERTYAGAVRRAPTEDLGELAAALRVAGVPSPDLAPIVPLLERTRGYAQLDLAEALVAARSRSERSDAADDLLASFPSGRMNDSVESMEDDARGPAARTFQHAAHADDAIVRAAAICFAAQLDDGIGTAVVLQHLADEDPDAAVRSLARALITRR